MHRRWSIALAGALMTTVPAFAEAQAPAPAYGGAGSSERAQIWVTPAAGISSETARRGDTIDIVVKRDVVIGGVIAVPRGTPGHAVVTWRTGTGPYGKSGKLAFDLVDIEIGGRPMAVAGHYRIDGKGEGPLAVATVILFGLVVGSQVTGHDAVVARGSEWMAMPGPTLDVAYATAQADAADPYRSGRAAGRAAVLASEMR